MTTPWYYDYYENRSFPHQEQLCKSVEWIPGCNLEGRRLVPTTHIQKLPDGTEKEYKTTALTRIPTNPLTLRLRALQNSLKHLEDEINAVNREIRKSANNQFNRGAGFSWGITLHTQDSQLETGGAAIEEIHLPQNRTIEFRYDTVHFALFDFFSNFASILDRLALEINLLYQLGDWLEERLGWTKLTNPRNRFLCCLNAKDQELADFIKNQRLNFKNIPNFRNRLLHDSIILIDINLVHFALDFKIFSGDPNKQKAQKGIYAIKFCKKAKADVLKLLDGSYELMLGYLKTHGQPPW